MAEPKTKQTNEDVGSFLDKISDDQRRGDCEIVRQMMEGVTGSPAKMWGSSIVGFGLYTYQYASGRKGEWPVMAFSPRKENLTLYISDGFEEREPLMERLGKFSTGKGCLYIKKLSDVDQDVLRKLLQASFEYFKKNNFRLDFSGGK